MKLKFSIQIWKKGVWFIAKCSELDFISQGRTKDEAQKNLMEVIEIQFEEMSDMGTLNDYLMTPDVFSHSNPSRLRRPESKSMPIR